MNLKIRDIVIEVLETLEESREYDQVLNFKVNQILGRNGDTIEELKNRIPEKTTARIRRKIFLERPDLRSKVESEEKTNRRILGRESHRIVQRDHMITPERNIGAEDFIHQGITIKNKTLSEKDKEFNHNMRGVIIQG